VSSRDREGRWAKSPWLEVVISRLPLPRIRVGYLRKSGLELVDANIIFRYLGSIFEIGHLIIAARDRPRGHTERGLIQATHSSVNPHFRAQVPVQSISSPRFCTKSIFSLTSSSLHELPRPQWGETRAPYCCRAMWRQLACWRWQRRYQPLASPAPTGKNSSPPAPYLLAPKVAADRQTCRSGASGVTAVAVAIENPGPTARLKAGRYTALFGRHNGRQ